jgi:hypothetical protein
MYGQSLTGDMIPKREVQVIKKPAVEKSEKKKGMMGLMNKASGSTKAAFEKVPLLGKRLGGKHG